MMTRQTASSSAWLVWSLAAAFFFSEYFARVAPSVMVPDLMRSFHVGALSLGALSAYFYYAYVGMQVPVGALVDRFGAHKLLTVMSALCGVGCVIFANTQTLFAAELGRFLMGLGAAFAFVGTLKLASIWFAPQRFGFLAGTTQALGMLGAAIGEGPVSVLVSWVGWRETMWIIGSVLLALSVLIALVVRDYPRGYIQTQPKEITSFKKVCQGLAIVLKNPQTWLNGSFVGFLFAPTAAFAELWGATYLHRVFQLSHEVAATAVSMIFVGWAIGGPMAGWISDRIKRRKPVLIASCIASFVFMSSALYLPIHSVFLIYVLLFFYGLSNVGVGVSYAVACEINPKSVAGISMSFANMASVLIGAAFQPLIGWFLDLQWDGVMQNGVPYYSANDFLYAMLLLPACFLLSLIAALLLKESYGVE